MGVLTNSRFGLAAYEACHSRGGKDAQPSKEIRELHPQAQKVFSG